MSSLEKPWRLWLLEDFLERVLEAQRGSSLKVLSSPHWVLLERSASLEPRVAETLVECVVNSKADRFFPGRLSSKGSRLNMQLALARTEGWYSFIFLVGSFPGRAGAWDARLAAHRASSNHSASLRSGFCVLAVRCTCSKQACGPQDMLWRAFLF